ncbi:MAG: hypothetical protein ACQEWI_01470 [Bacillota bacterium]
MEMIERYIYAVTNKLPQSQRDEIGREIRGLIHDMLEVKVGNRKTTEEDIEEVLVDLGIPSDMADKYRGGGRYLISPDLFYPYLHILKIVLISISIALSIVFVIETIMNPVSIINHFVGLIVSLIQVGTQTFAWITIVFAFIDYRQVISGEVKKGKVQEWKPADLPPIPDHKKEIKRGEVLTGIIFSILFLILILFSNRMMGVFVFEENEFKGIAPFLNPETLNDYLLLIYLIVGLGIFKESLKLIIGRWTKKLGVSTLIINVVTLILGLFLLMDQQIWNPTFVEDLFQLRGLNLLDQSYETINSIWEQSKEWVVIGFIVTIIVDTVSVLYKGFKK